MPHRSLARRTFMAGALATSVAGCRRDRPGARATTPPAVVDGDPYAALRGMTAGIVAPSPGEFARHRACVAEEVGRQGLDAVVVEPGAAMGYLSGVRWGLSERPFLLVVTAAGDASWVVPAFETHTAGEQLGRAAPDAAVITWQEHENAYDKAGEVLRAGGVERPAIACDPATRHFVAAGLRAAVTGLGGRFDDGADPVGACRIRKTEIELSRLRRANTITKAALAAVASRFGAGIDQRTVADEVRTAQEVAGLSDVWVLALIGQNAAFPHGTKHDRRAHDGDLILVDTGGALHGYRSDITRTWAIGTPSAPARKAWETVREAQSAAFSAMRPGVRAGAVDRAARAVIEAAGYGNGYGAMTHRLGHGIGLQVHEAPYLRPGAETVLQPGMTMSNEPGIYRPGDFGVRLEDIVAITDDGVEVFGPQVGSMDHPFAN